MLFLKAKKRGPTPFELAPVFEMSSFIIRLQFSCKIEESSSIDASPNFGFALKFNSWSCLLFLMMALRDPMAWAP